jgi:anti-anti-sigma factor
MVFAIPHSSFGHWSFAIWSFPVSPFPCEASAYTQQEEFSSTERRLVPLVPPGDTPMDDNFGSLLVYDAGPSALVGFKSCEIVDDNELEKFREGLQLLVRENHTETLVLDLTGVKSVSSGTLGFLFHLHQQGVKIRLYNPSEHIREVLEITQLGKLFPEVDMPQQ